MPQLILTRADCRRLKRIGHGLGWTTRRGGSIHIPGCEPRRAILSHTTGTLITRLPGDAPAKSITFPSPLICAPASGTATGLVDVSREADAVTLRWNEGGLPRALTGPLSAETPLPDRPDTWFACDRRLIRSLHAAAALTDAQETRYPTGFIRLGERAIVATDTRRLVRFEGFEFPWNDARLVRVPPLLARSNFTCFQPTQLGFTPQALVLRDDVTELYVPWITGVRYPEIGRALPDVTERTTRVLLDASEAGALAKLLKSIADDRIVTLDVGNGLLVVRFPGEAGGPPSEVVLRRSSVELFPARLALRADHLWLALTLSCREFLFFGKARPLLGRGEDMTYICAVADDSHLTLPHVHSVRIDLPLTIPTRRRGDLRRVAT